MKYIHIIAWFLIATMLVACHSKSFKINGTVEGAHEGDTLYLSYDIEQGTPSDSFYVKDGKFSYEGKTDSTRLSLIYDKNQIDINTTFFIEPGEIDNELVVIKAGHRNRSDSKNRVETFEP